MGRGLVILELDRCISGFAGCRAWGALENVLVIGCLYKHGFTGSHGGFGGVLKVLVGCLHAQIIIDFHVQATCGFQ